MVHSFISQFALCVLILTSAFAFFKAGVAERLGAILVCTSWLGGDAVSFFLKDLLSQQSLETTLLVMDGALALGFLALALRFTKMWLGTAMLMQSGELALHGAAMADWGLSFKTYLIFNNLLSFGLILLLICATVIEWLHRRHARISASAADAPESAKSSCPSQGSVTAR